MTDLEKMWDSYDAGDAPLGRLLRAGVAAAGEQTDGRAGAAGGADPATAASPAAATPPRGSAEPIDRRRRIVVRPLLTAAAATALIGAAVGGAMLTGGSDDGGADLITALPSHVAFQADLPAAADCDELLGVYKERARKLVTAYGWGGGPIGYATGGGPLLNGVQRNAQPDAVTGSVGNGAMEDSGKLVKAPAAPAEAGKELNAADTPQVQGQHSSKTGTNVQEAGVDEPDTVKTDGRRLITVRDTELTVYDVSGSSTKELGSVRIDGIAHPEILLDGNTVVALGATDTATQTEPAQQMRVTTVSIADPAAPAVTGTVTYDSTLVSARQHGHTVRLVLSAGLPDLAFVQPGGNRSEQKALEKNQELVASSTIQDWLPTVTKGDGAPEQLLECTNVAIPDPELALDTVSVVGFSTADTAAVDAIGLAGSTNLAYESTGHLYLGASNPGWWGGCETCLYKDYAFGPAERRIMPPSGTSSGTTYLFDFTLDGASATHVASGEVEGTVRDRWAMDEVGDVLRVAVSPTQETGNFNSVVTFRRDGHRLSEVGRLDKLGVGEDLKSVRWFEGMAVLVTFREIDPLYAIDLTRPAHPKLLGKLKIPGFSSYLHPMDRLRMFGVGEGPDDKGRWGAQVGLFNVNKVRNVRRLDVVDFPGARPLAARDPRAFTWVPEKRTAIAVLERNNGRRVGYVGIVKAHNSALTARIIEVEYGDDVDLVRAVPVGGGRVVLVTGEKAQFLELQ